MGERETYRVPLKLQAKMASLSLIPSNKKRFPSWIDSGSLSPSPLNFNSNHEKSQQRKTETFIFVLFNTKRHINSLSTSTKLTNLQQKISILPRIVGDVGQSEQPPPKLLFESGKCCCRVCRVEEEEEEEDLFSFILFSYFFFWPFSVLSLAAASAVHAPSSRE
jgi:hypothetical protein